MIQVALVPLHFEVNSRDWWSVFAIYFSKTFNLFMLAYTFIVWIFLSNAYNLNSFSYSIDKLNGKENKLEIF